MDSVKGGGRARVRTGFRISLRIRVADQGQDYE